MKNFNALLIAKARTFCSLCTPLERVLLAAFCIVWPLGQLGRIQLTPTVALYAHDVILSLWLIVQSIGALQSKTTGRSILSKLTSRFSQHYLGKNFRNIVVLLAVLIAWIVLGMVWATIESGDSIPWLYLVRLLVYLGSTLSIAHKLSPSTLCSIILWLTGSYWLLAWMQYVFLPDARFLAALGFDDHYYRMIGTLADPAFTGMIGLVFLIVLKLHHSNKRQWYFWPTIFAIFAGIIVTYSRATYLATVPVGVLMLLLEQSAAPKWQRIKKLSVGIGVALSVGTLLYFLAPRPGGEGVNLLRTASISARFATATRALETASIKTLVLGNGLFSAANTPLSPSTAAHDLTLPTRIDHARMPDNFLITLLTQTGGIGLVLSTVLIWKLWQYWYQLVPEKAILFAGLLIHSQFNNTILQPFVLVLILLFFFGKKPVTAT